jgi:hypothetical protein
MTTSHALISIFTMSGSSYALARCHVVLPRNIATKFLAVIEGDVSGMSRDVERSVALVSEMKGLDS